MANGHGGARPGAGRKPGKVSQAKRDLMTKAKRHADAALHTLVEIATKGESEPARVTAAIAILDRAYGKPIQATVELTPEQAPEAFTGWEIHRAESDPSYAH